MPQLLSLPSPTPQNNHCLSFGAALGRGGSAVVYGAEHPAWGAVAVKGGDHHREAQALDRIRHPRVPRVHALYEDALVMERVPGTTLNEAPWHGLASGLALAGELAVILEAVHAAGIVHCDLKPSNVMVDPLGNPWLIDFGIARSEGEQALNDAGAIEGTPAYMAPEQLRGGTVTAATDVYALGALLYWLWTGKNAFDGDPEGLLMEKEGEYYPPATALGGVACPELSALVASMLRPEPSERPTLAAVRQTLARLDVVDAGRAAQSVDAVGTTAVLAPAHAA